MILKTDDILVIVPAFNEERSIPHVLRELQEHGYRHLVVSDGSTDGTTNVAIQLGSSVLELPLNLGVGGALRAGFRYAVKNNYRAVVQIDADGQHPVESIGQLIDAVNTTQAHLVLGSRFVSKDTTMSVSPLRRMVMRFLAKSVSHATGTTITDATSGFRLIREPLLSQFAKTFPDNYLGDTYEALLATGRAGYTVVEIPAGLRSRTHGVSTASRTDAVKFTLKCLGVALLQIHLRFEPWQGCDDRDTER